MTSTLASLLDSRYTIFLGWTLVVALWQTTAIGVMFAGWLVWRPLATATHRYRIAVLAFSVAALVAVSAPFQLALLQNAAAVVARTVITSSPNRGATAAESTPVHTSLTGTSIERTLPSPIMSADTFVAIVAVIWVLGVVVLACRVLGGLWLAYSIAGRAAPVRDTAIATAASRLRVELNVGRIVRVLESSQVEAPVVIGWRVPTLILPHDAAERLSSNMVAALLAHEFAHIRRRDFVANLAQSVAEMLLFFSPLVVWMSHRIREAREFCCDDVAVMRCGDPKHYVDALTNLASLGAVNTARPALSATGPRLITRVRRLLQGEAMPTFPRARIIGLASLFLILIVTGMQVSAASAARAPRLTLRAPSPSFAIQDKIPYGFATEQVGSGVELQRIVSTIEEPAQLVIVKNLSNQPVIGLRFTAAVERWTRVSRLPVKLFMSPIVAVSIPPGQSLEVAPNVLTASQVQAVAAESPGATIQLFFGLQAVSFANGYNWTTTPNPSTLSGTEALNIPRPIYSRNLIARDANRPPVAFTACRDEQNRATSHGGRVPILNEPGHFMVCNDGRWIDAGLRR
jgi:beta-lactamase regulating signal transducer with metallopeptidase domain